ncbi:hypothetical protein PHLGIDRAFT_75887 [Phlebiopsis gigantea 11061_1 CR5-6]|uniref:Tyrosine specific protein phosphatases domain-containing protein n=1 Tax=Phlebiopsis gigantea (strain 11061_1 CR5-6) TaxID=745531 RepID=A0A0C3RU64_PHLG1|nr:hypothetical protein PHLGIDRAFT_75887 [Phlebiopsis gigantea 11061_1 CR5-6]
MPQLLRSGPSVVKTRQGSVLSRGFILKTDYWPSGEALDLELNVHGAPNFRAPREGNLNVFGVAQPRTQGLRGILSVLRCRPQTPNPTHVIWFSTREEPVDRAENLEAIELRLKNDILAEAQKYGGLILTHNEVASDSGEGAILPTWTSVDVGNVRTMRELMEGMKKEGWNVDENYLDAYTRIIKCADPLRTAVVFNCGQGAVRTTFAMAAACIIRRKQLIDRGLDDPFAPRSGSHRSGISTVSRLSTIQYYRSHVPLPDSLLVARQVADLRLMQSMEQASLQHDLNRSLLKITYILQQCLPNSSSQSPIELLLTKPDLLNNLRKAHMGNYGIILSLLGCLEQGLMAKKLVDRVIDSCDQVTNLREDIFVHRIRYSLTSSMDEEERDIFLDKAVRALEKYFFIIAFANFVETEPGLTQTFSDWLKARTELSNQILFLRKTYGSRLNIFQPVNDLSSLSKSGAEGRALVPGQKNDIAISGGQILGDEYSDHVVKNRSGIILREGTLLKSDQWLGESQQVPDGVRGAINFRNIPGTKIYALGQPSLDAIDEVVKRIKQANPSTQQVLWITLREEPIVYINGAPYCLRRERFTLRNMKDYGGISASRLEVLEERLRDDVVSELASFGGRLLLHTETHDGSVVPVWEEIETTNISVLKEIMASRRPLHDGVELKYARVPITAERPPDFSDLTDLIDVVLRNPNTPIVVNCQLGRGRSTMTAIVLVLVRKWLEDANRVVVPPTPRLTRSVTLHSFNDTEPARSDRHSYQIINNLLRVVRKGHTVKNTVDDAIDQCSEVFNLRDSIEEARNLAEQAPDERQKRLHAQRGLQNLRRYFELIIFQAYLQTIEPDTMSSLPTIEAFVKERPVIKTFEKELMAEGIQALKPLERVDVREGMPLPDEVQQVVANRSGTILSASTILKSDFFSNLQKMSLPERIDGSPNFRRVPLVLRRMRSGTTSPTEGPQFVASVDEGKWVSGSGMPTVEGLRRALSRVDASPKDTNMVYWTSLREEPVIYVAGRPHVLRLVDKPLENVEATGVTTVMVERMEEKLKEDVLREVRAGGGRILLHDEVEERPGVFSIIPIWEQVSEEDIMTPRNVFELMVKEGFHVDYDRVAVTDEQAPLPDALQQLLERIQLGFDVAGDFVFNCQMGRGRTTTGMVTACLIATTATWNKQDNEAPPPEESDGMEIYDSMDGPSEEEAYLQGEYKTILQLVGVLSHGKMAKRLTDQAIDLMQDVQNLRKAIYDYKLKVDAAEKGSVKQRKLLNLGINYMYRYGALIVFANYLIEMREHEEAEMSFPDWLRKHREIAKLLSRRSLD